MRVDAHHHLWRYTPDEYGWIDDSMKVLRRDFLPDDLVVETDANGIQATVVVQARQTLHETDWLLDLASSSPVIGGVVGWAPIAADDFPEYLAQLHANPLLKGLRHVLQGEPEGFLDGPGFNRGIAAIRDSGLVYDLLILASQLPEATRFVDRHPKQVFVLDHIAKPGIAAGSFEPWNSSIRELARRKNVFCKLSGMVTEADWAAWTPETLAPWFESVLEAFTPERLMVGTDWPVVTVACAYSRWWQTVSEWLAPLSTTEREQIEGDTAAGVYGLQPK